MKSIIGLLNEIIRLLGGLFAGEDAAAKQAEANQAELNALIASLQTNLQTAIAINHDLLRRIDQLIEGEEPTVTGIEVQEGTH